jgi:hypothetical protein
MNSRAVPRFLSRVLTPSKQIKTKADATTAERPLREPPQASISPYDHPVFIHQFVGRPLAHLRGYGDPTPDPRDQQIYSAVRAAYQRQLNETAQVVLPDVWAGFIDVHRKYLDGLFASSDEAALESLRNLFITPLTHGFQQGSSSFSSLTDPATGALTQEHILKEHVDKLVALAEALGVINVENPEQGELGTHVHGDPDRLLDLIENEIGHRIEAPKFSGGLYGLKTRRGLFTNRDFVGIYVAHRLSQIVSDKSAPLCEIGAGAGYVAYYGAQFGFRNFTLIDLPSTNFAQGFFLSRNIQDLKIYLYEGLERFVESDGIKVYPPQLYQKAPRKFFEIILNVDSLPEIDQGVASDYLQIAKRIGKMFLSINQESMAVHLGRPQLRVNKLFKNVGGFTRLGRYPFWLRKGFVEELYSCE